MSDRILLCLDLNGTIMCRKRHTKTCKPRPYLKEFLRYAFEEFDIGIWSSGTTRNMDPLVKSLFGDYYQLLKFTFYRDMCDLTPTNEEPWATTKNIQLIPLNYSSIIIIDDTAEKIKNLGPNDHHYEITSFDGCDADTHLQALISFLVIKKLDKVLDELENITFKLDSLC